MTPVADWRSRRSKTSKTGATFSCRSRFRAKALSRRTSDVHFPLNRRIAFNQIAVRIDPAIRERNGQWVGSDRLSGSTVASKTVSSSAPAFEQFAARSSTNSGPRTRFPRRPQPLEPNAVNRTHEANVATACDRWMISQRRAAGAQLFVFLARMPSDGRRRERNLGALQGGNRSGSGYHFPADQHPDVAISESPTPEPGVAWGEKELSRPGRPELHLAIAPATSVASITTPCCGQPPSASRTAKAMTHDLALAGQLLNAPSGTRIDSAD